MIIWKLIDDSYATLSALALQFENTPEYDDIANHLRSCSNLLYRSKPKNIKSNVSTQSCSSFNNLGARKPPYFDTQYIAQPSIRSPKDIHNEHGGSVVLAGYSIPKDKHDMGDDAWYISENTSAFGVADGVGSWKDLGLEPRLFSDHLLNSCKNYLEKSLLSKRHKEPILMEALSYAFEEVQRSENYGSSTVLTGYFDVLTNDLHIASLGDSQCIILRLYQDSYTCMWTTPIQEHSFNCPLQLAHIPKPQRCFEKGFSDLGCVLDSLHVVSDHPSQAIIQQVSVYTNDIVIAGTDGLFDNLSIKQIERVTNRHILNVTNLTSYHAQSLVTALCREAFDSSKKPIATALSGDGFGGKEDDITCVIACVVSSSSVEV